MKSISKRGVMTMLVLALTAMAVFASQASARDRNHNGISDRWEKRHHISTKTNQARRDPDRDGLSNRCEFQGSTNPRSKDSDHDGVRDGAEDSDDDGISNRGESRLHSDCGEDSSEVEVHRATITSFVDGVLTLALGGGGTLSAPVADPFKCEKHVASAPTPATGAVASSEGSDDDGPGHDAGDDDDGQSSSDDDGEDDSVACTTADLVPGAQVHEAKISGGKFVKIELEG